MFLILIMANVHAEKILDNMVAFIKQHGEEERINIEKKMNEDFTVKKNQFIMTKQKEIEENFKNQLQNEKNNYKIDMSKM